MHDRRRSKRDERVRRLFISSLILLYCSIGAFAQAQRSLLGARRTDVDVTRDTTLDVALPSGFVLSGKILVDDPLSVMGSAVLARSNDRTFSGEITVDFSIAGLTAAYRIVLPAGNYRLYFRRLILEDSEAGEGAVLQVVSDLSRTVAITADRTLDITPPQLPGLISLSGRITSAGRFPAKGFLLFSSADGNVSALVPFDPTYRARLLPGSYTVTAWITDPEREDADWTSVRLGQISVSASSTRDFTLPAAIELSGRVTRATGSPAVPAQVIAIATADLAKLPSDAEWACESGAVRFDLPVVSAMTRIPEESATGAYRLLLVPGTYRLNAEVDLDPNDETNPRLSFSFLERALTADTTQNFTLPSLPSFVTLSGRITDQRGQPVARAFVFATTSTLSGTPNAAFTAATEADAQGRYRLRLLSGRAYQITICPPTPSPTLPSGLRARRHSSF
ncbi:MAG: carboxypeptidase-like regulatory domain-containing protein [Blastocatellia bacterium]|nr:carboxypeptidase-like regulatory domain-containing protein [Blastocatellia bacterium]MCS7156265.1 carboxypeptidase-like regulatory domain-containing protein [Blastocatellia bacterium]MCX7751385.1 carboxypeptidase-like regulatory domain-containing protein [Blastocatellia bacterium]MDW8169098.1 carboxypeptidase-like regulatory domain-containing protein [Acidobacteriota bacterium]MDW8255802.1 carboxypeptidase-like regulatory domain-containing protein [Acidobacteriota bacterium]